MVDLAAGHDISRPAISRHPRSADRSAHTTTVLVFERTFHAPIEDVWAAVTESDRLARWIGVWTDVHAIDFDYYPALKDHYRAELA